MDTLENQAHLKVFPVNGQLVWGVLHFNPPALADCQRSIGNFHLTTSSPPWRRFFWSPWKTPISTWLHSLWNQFSLFCSYSPWVTMDTAPHWFDLSMNLFMSSNLEWKGMFFYLSSSQSKHDLLIGHSMKLHSNAFFFCCSAIAELVRSDCENTSSTFTTCSISYTRALRVPPEHSEKETWQSAEHNLVWSTRNQSCTNVASSVPCWVFSASKIHGCV